MKITKNQKLYGNTLFIAETFSELYKLAKKVLEIAKNMLNMKMLFQELLV